MTEDHKKQGANWYDYCSNDPVKRTDPTGFHEGEAPTPNLAGLDGSNAWEQSMADQTAAGFYSDYNVAFLQALTMFPSGGVKTGETVNGQTQVLNSNGDVVGMLSSFGSDQYFDGTNGSTYELSPYTGWTEQGAPDNSMNPAELQNLTGIPNAVWSFAAGTLATALCPEASEFLFLDADAGLLPLLTNSAQNIVVGSVVGGLTDTALGVGPPSKTIPQETLYGTIQEAATQVLEYFSDCL